MTATDAAASSPRTVWRFDGFELDTQHYELRRDGTAIPVEPQVFDALTQLIVNHDRVVTKEQSDQGRTPGTWRRRRVAAVRPDRPRSRLSVRLRDQRRHCGRATATCGASAAPASAHRVLSGGRRGAVGLCRGRRARRRRRQSRAQQIVALQNKTFRSRINGHDVTPTIVSGNFRFG